MFVQDICKQKTLLVKKINAMRLLTFSQWRDLRMGVINVNVLLSNITFL